MGIEVPGKDSSPGKRAAWFAIGFLAIAIGLTLTIGSLTQVEDTADLVFTALLWLPGILYVFSGIRLILRVSGKQRGLPVRGPLGLSLTLTAISGSFLTMVFLLFWALGRSSWVHEGGDLSDFPNSLMIASIVAGVVTIVAVVLAIVSTRIEDGRSTESQKP